ncbi:MAG: autotransporter-associated beta strand repeat-containing protein [Kiritimatiellae bacterium]|nr:autotransporter-associated beta strand repeat-containing protein [Kiritimatiellia bacterium]
MDAICVLLKKNDTLTDNHVFAGDSLTLGNNGYIGWKSMGKCTINNLIADGGYLTHSRDSNLARLYGNIWINPGKTFQVKASDKNYRHYDIYSQISGAGNLQFFMDVGDDRTSKIAMLHGVNTNFFGRVVFERDGHLGFTDERALGANPSAYTYNQLSIYGGWIYLTNSIAIDDANRGINLRANATDGLNGGGFEVANSATATVSCVINGAGDLSKQGGGTLILATNETYSGKTIVKQGLLLVASNATLASSAVVLEGGSFGSQVSGCEINNLIFDGGGIFVDPSVDDPATVRLTVSGSISNSAFSPIIVNVQSLDTVQQEFKILDSEGLAGIGAHDLCVNPPWAGFLSVQDNGSGGKVLVLTTQPESMVIYQNANDGYGESAFLDIRWTDGLIPSAGKIYINQSYSLRTPQNGSHTFAGDRLIIDGGTIGMKGAGMPTVNDLVVMNNSRMLLSDSPICKINGNVTLHPVLASGRRYALLLQGLTPLRTFHMYASLHGYGELRMNCGGDPAYGHAAYPLLAKNTNFFGRVRLDGDTNFSVRVTCEENIGGSPPAFRADQLAFNGGGISVTNNVTLDDVNRGITLFAAGGISDISEDTGGYPPETPEAERRYAGGAVFSADYGHTLAIRCPVTGAGTVSKAGAGFVELSGNNTYNSLTTVLEGGLVAGSANAFGKGPVRVDGAGRLVCRYSDSMLPNGVELGGTIEFINGGAVKVELAGGAIQPPGSFSVPLFLLPAGGSISPQDVPLEHTLKSVFGEVVTSNVGSQILVSARFTCTGGSLILIQ